jgi:lysozyme
MSTLEQTLAAFIAPFEAPGGVPVLTAYQDMAGVWTIGFGTTYYLDAAGNEVDVEEGLVWDADQCMSALANYLKGTVSMLVSANMRHPWTADMITALGSLAYNIGQSAFMSSSALKFHNDGNSTAAAAAFLLWDKAHVNGELVVVNGLLERREAEAAKYLSQA